MIEKEMQTADELVQECLAANPCSREYAELVIERALAELAIS